MLGLEQLVLEDRGASAFHQAFRRVDVLQICWDWNNWWYWNMRLLLLFYKQSEQGEV
jgi:hypothetical protein